MPKVYLTSFLQLATGDLAAVALADDGEVLAEHVCSAPAFFRGDLHDRDFRRDAYVRKYGLWGDGDRYEVVECGSSEVPAEVIERNRLLYAEDQPAMDSRPYPTGWAGCDIPGHQGCDPWNCRWAPVEPGASTTAPNSSGGES